MRAGLLLVMALLSGCAGLQTAEKPQFSAVGFSALPGWQGDAVIETLPALKNSCARRLKQAPDRALGMAGTAADWQNFCRGLARVQTEGDLRALLQRELQPYAVTAGSNAEGLFTGYYEASLRGSRQQGGRYQTPLYARPADLVMVNLGEFRDELKGQRIAGRVVEGQLKPYADRAAIVAGKLGPKGQPLVWLDDPVDAFFVQVQGSGRVELAEGGVMHLGYAGQNGHPYTAIGRSLIARGALTKENVSMQSIRAWLAANPSAAAGLMNENKSYVFFREMPSNAGPEGAEGVPLTPLRSLAIDPTVISYGVPVWLEAEDPRESGAPLQRLVVAQDTGGAIRGIVRGDFFWGHGAEAEHAAGLMKSRGRYFVLLPRSVRPTP